MLKMTLVMFFMAAPLLTAPFATMANRARREGKGWVVVLSITVMPECPCSVRSHGRGRGRGLDLGCGSHWVL